MQALQNAPYAFSTTLTSARSRKAADWQEQAESAVFGSERAIFIAFRGKHPVGMAALYQVKGESGLGELLQVWINPQQRGTLLAKNLIDTVFSWAKENGYTRIKAGVTRENPHARSFYYRYGFRLLEETDIGAVLVKEIT